MSEVCCSDLLYMWCNLCCLDLLPLSQYLERGGSGGSGGSARSTMCGFVWLCDMSGDIIVNSIPNIRSWHWLLTYLTVDVVIIQVIIFIAYSRIALLNENLPVSTGCSWYKAQSTMTTKQPLTCRTYGTVLWAHFVRVSPGRAQTAAVRSLLASKPTLGTWHAPAGKLLLDNCLFTCEIFNSKTQRFMDW